VKKAIVSIILLFAVAASFAAAPTTWTLGPANWELVKVSTATVRCGGTTEATILAGLPVSQGWEYVLCVNDSVAAAADSLLYYATSYGTNGTTIMNKVDIGHSLTAAAYGVFAVPIGTTLFPSAITLSAKKLTATVYATVLRWELYRRKVQCCR
jgi:hypothetical protein